MASTEPVVRYKHVSLPTQQRRLRHLRMIAARNVVPLRDQTRISDISQTEIYFTLHKDNKTQAFYSSEKIKGSSNPTWRSFNLEHVINKLQMDGLTTAGRFLIIRLWQGISDKFQLCVEWSVHLDGLVYLGDKTQKEGIQSSPNTILFGMHDGVYAVQSSLPSSANPVTRLEVDHASVRESYSTQTLLRIKTVLRAIKQTQCTAQKVKKSIEDKLLYSHSLEQKRSYREMQILRNKLMCGDLEWRRRALQGEKDTYENLKTENQQKEKKLEIEFDSLHEKKSDLDDKKRAYFDTRDELIKTGAQLVLRRKQLISELAFIYPILEMANKDYIICGVKLPNSEDFIGHGEIMVAIALGYTCHLVSMISHFLDVPLRYPMEHLGSKSLIRDHIIDKLNERERDFPLYGKGKEKFQFNYGVYLLNKNVAQLRYYCGLSTTDLRLTLPNLKNMLEFRLGVRFESTNAPVLAGQHMAIPPNLGGPQKTTSPSFGLPQKSKQSSSETISTPSSESQTISTPSESPLSPKIPSEKVPYCGNFEVKNNIFEKDKKDRSVMGDNGVDRTEQNSNPQSCDIDSKLITSDTNTAYIEPELITSPTTATNYVCSNDSSVEVVKACDASVPGGDISNHHRNRTKCNKECDQTAGDYTASMEKRTRSLTPQSLKTLDSLSREKILGSIGNYDDLDMSSSEDSASAVYTSRFKLWPRDHPDIQLAEPQWAKEDQEKINSPSKVISCNDVDSVSETSEPATFKTKAMTPLNTSASPDDLLTKVEVKEPWAVNSVLDHKPSISAVARVAGPFRRKRTDSDADADAEEAATFVIADSKQKPIFIKES